MEKNLQFETIKTKNTTILSQTNGLLDPIGDSIHHKGHGIIHRYDCRALLLVSDICDESCAHCFRQNNMNSFDFDLNYAAKYLEAHPKIYEVILSGGDPFSLPLNELNKIISKVSKISSIHFLRIHTRTIVISPEKINIQVLETINSLIKNGAIKSCSIAFHINHPDEISATFRDGIGLIKKYDIELLSQTVLLKDFNDSSKVLTKLFLELQEIGIRPYYLHHPDQVKGAMQFQISYESGSKIYQKLKQTLPGHLIPHYALDDASGKKRAPFL